MPSCRNHSVQGSRRGRTLRPAAAARRGFRAGRGCGSFVDLLRRRSPWRWIFYSSARHGFVRELKSITLLINTNLIHKPASWWTFSARRVAGPCCRHYKARALTERCRSGRSGRSRKPLCPLGFVGSNPTLSARNQRVTGRCLDLFGAVPDAKKSTAESTIAVGLLLICRWLACI